MESLEQQCDETIKKLEVREAKLDTYGAIIIPAGVVIGGVAGALIGHYCFSDSSYLSEAYGAIAGMICGTWLPGVAIDDIQEEIENERGLHLLNLDEKI